METWFYKCIYYARFVYTVLKTNWMNTFVRLVRFSVYIEFVHYKTGIIEVISLKLKPNN